MKKIFVFGSNLRGIHGAGAAYFAAEYHGAIAGQGQGAQGTSYAIPTKSGPYQRLQLEDISIGVQQFIAYARERPDLTFEVTAIGCGLAGYNAEQIAPMFKDCPSNCELPIPFLMVLQKMKSVA